MRIAGVEVGKVSKVEPAGDDSPATVVTMKLKDEALPIHEDAQLKIRPRIFLEGNFFVDLRPGTPSARRASTPATRSRPTQTTAPVQLDQVLGTLKSDTPQGPAEAAQGYGDAIDGEPQPGEDDDQDPRRRRARRPASR